MTSPRPIGGQTGVDREILARGARDPSIADTPEYAMAFNSLYGERIERLANGEQVVIQPAVPPGIVRPTARAQSAVTGGQVAPAAGPSPEAAGGGQVPAGAPAAAGDTRTVTTPGGGQVSITSTQPRQLGAAELKIKEETETNLQNMRDAEGSLREALRLSPQAYAGPGATLRGSLMGTTGLDQPSAVATRSLTSIMTEQALSQLRAIFGGNPTEGERKILLDMGASANMSRPEREALLNRAIDAVQRRQSDATRRLREVASGEYGRVQPGYTPPAAAPTPPPPPGYEVLR